MATVEPNLTPIRDNIGKCRTKLDSFYNWHGSCRTKFYFF